MKGKRFQMMIEKGMHKVIFIYLILLGIIFPFYVENGYYHLASAKFHMFQILHITAVSIIIFCYSILFCTGYYRFALARWTTIDWLIFGYLISVLVSFIISDYGKEAFWGATGWYMGTFTQCSMVFIYFATRQYAIYNKQSLLRLLECMIIASTVIALLGICNSFSFYPIAMKGREYGFLSTLGNVNWYCGYFSIWYPLTIGSWYINKSEKISLLKAIELFIMDIALLCQESIGGYMILILCTFMMLLSVGEKGKLLDKWMLHLLIISYSMVMIRVIGVFVPLGEILHSKICYWICTNNISFYVTIIGTILYWAYKRFVPNIQMGEGVKCFLWCFPCLFIGMLLFLFVLNSIIPQGIWPVSNYSSFYFNEAWGNGRGGIWIRSVEAIKEMTGLQVLFGVGPDCYVEYIYQFPNIVEKIKGQFGLARLTCAHNEWMNLLVNQGLISLGLYIGIIINLIQKLREKWIDYNMLLCFLYGIVCYTIFHMVSFAQILSTPFIFLVFGLSQGLIKAYENDKMINCLGTKKE